LENSLISGHLDWLPFKPNEREMKNKKTSPFIITAAIIIVIAGMMQAQSIVIPILLSLFISIVCTQPILWLSKRKVPFTVAVFIVLISILLIFTLIGGLIGESLSAFAKDAPKYEDSLKTIFNDIMVQLNQLGIQIKSDQFLQVLDPKKIINFSANMVGQLGGIMSNSFLIMLITIFILLEIDGFVLKTRVIELKHGNSLKYLNKIGDSIRNYLSIKTIVSFLTGILITIYLYIIGVDYAILWGTIAFMLNYIPNIGSIIAAVPTMLLALVQLGVGGMIWTGIGYLAVNLIVGNIIEPKVMGKGLGLSTLVVFLSLIFWGFIFGSVGMFLSVPLTMTIKIILESSKDTSWIAVLLGTEEETKRILDES
jgi:predicted PurR-regulated permease PerM